MEKKDKRKKAKEYKILEEWNKQDLKSKGELEERRWK